MTFKKLNASLIGYAGCCLLSCCPAKKPLIVPMVYRLSGMFSCSYIFCKWQFCVLVFLFFKFSFLVLLLFIIICLNARVDLYRTGLVTAGIFITVLTLIQRVWSFNIKYYLYCRLFIVAFIRLTIFLSIPGLLEIYVMNTY